MRQRRSRGEVLASIDQRNATIAKRIGITPDSAAKVYDALYLALAQVNSANLVTADPRLYNSVALELDFVEYLANYQGLTDRE
ncbi:hypothetical protein ABN584_02585 [Gloeocapsa sp. BRSZ]